MEGFNFYRHFMLIFLQLAGMKKPLRLVHSGAEGGQQAVLLAHRFLQGLQRVFLRSACIGRGGIL